MANLNNKNMNQYMVETFEVPDDIFCNHILFCLRYDKEISSDEYNDSSREYSDIVKPMVRQFDDEVGPLKVTGILHCCKPIGVIKDGTKLIIQSSNPL